MLTRLAAPGSATLAQRHQRIAGAATACRTLHGERDEIGDIVFQE
jgi:hypothetical protein